MRRPWMMASSAELIVLLVSACGRTPVPADPPSGTLSFADLVECGGRLTSRDRHFEPIAIDVERPPEIIGLVVDALPVEVGCGVEVRGGFELESLDEIVESDARIAVAIQATRRALDELVIHPELGELPDGRLVLRFAPANSNILASVASLLVLLSGDTRPRAAEVRALFSATISTCGAQGEPKFGVVEEPFVFCLRCLETFLCPK